MTITKRTSMKVRGSSDFNQNARRNAQALSEMTETERWCGKTAEDLRAEQRAMKDAARLRSAG